MDTLKLTDRQMKALSSARRDADGRDTANPAVAKQLAAKGLVYVLGSFNQDTSRLGKGGGKQTRIQLTAAGFAAAAALAQVVASHAPVLGPAVTIEEVAARGQAVLVSPQHLLSLIAAAKKAKVLP